MTEKKRHLIPKINIDIWEEEDIQTWRHRYNHITYLMGMMSIINIAQHIWNSTTMSNLMILLNSIPVVLWLVIWLSYKKYQKQQLE